MLNCPVFLMLVLFQNIFEENANIKKDYNIPWSSIAFATLMNPATFAPLT